MEGSRSCTCRMCTSAGSAHCVKVSRCHHIGRPWRNATDCQCRSPAQHGWRRTVAGTSLVIISGVAVSSPALESAIRCTAADISSPGVSSDDTTGRCFAQEPACRLESLDLMQRCSMKPDTYESNVSVSSFSLRSRQDRDRCQQQLAARRNPACPNPPLQVRTAPIPINGLQSENMDLQSTQHGHSAAKCLLAGTCEPSCTPTMQIPMQRSAMHWRHDAVSSCDQGNGHP